MRVEWKAAAALARHRLPVSVAGSGREFAARVSEILVRETEDETRMCRW
ncbi:MAG: hypothetical protein ACLVJ6_05695 [Merdibacter sp.]